MGSSSPPSQLRVRNLCSTVGRQECCQCGAALAARAGGAGTVRGCLQQPPEALCFRVEDRGVGGWQEVGWQGGVSGCECPPQGDAQRLPRIQTKMVWFLSPFRNAVATPMAGSAVVFKMILSPHLHFPAVRF